MSSPAPLLLPCALRPRRSAVGLPAAANSYIFDALLASGRRHSIISRAAPPSASPPPPPRSAPAAPLRHRPPRRCRALLRPLHRGRCVPSLPSTPLTMIVFSRSTAPRSLLLRPVVSCATTASIIVCATRESNI
ncbi:hypothetical protein U9M48_012385 [Paspalum notatum var. saurae]|uniref:Uncharacterized protein n=1 Tax=Paspalum notatum var. saurae TaxID=547442 RepID=A0AAQ3WII1_PASNO